MLWTFITVQASMFLYFEPEHAQYIFYQQHLAVV